MLPRLLLLASFLAGLAAAQIDISYQKFVLNNGLTVIVHEDHKAPVVAVNVCYHVGSKNERPGKTGFAHLFEHLMFGGSENAKGSYIQALERIGATDLNGTTNTDRTNYFETVPASALDYALFMESDRMGHFIGSFDKATLDQQRGVVQNEKRQGENQPYGLAYSNIVQNTYPASHPYSWSVVGSMDDLNAASLDDVKQWFRTNYGPSNTTLVLAGDIDLNTAKAKVSKYFGDIPSGGPLFHQEQWIAKMNGVHRAILQDRVPQARIYRTWNVPGFGTPEADYLDLASDCLTKGRTSRLYKRLVYDDQIATAVNAYLNPQEIGGQFTVIVTAKVGADLQKVQRALDEEMSRFLKDGPTADELRRTQTQYYADFLRGLDRVGGFGGKSDILAQAQVYTGDPSYLFKTSLERHQQAAPSDVKKAANEWLGDGLFELDVIPMAHLTEVAGSFDRSKPPAITASKIAKLPAVQRTTLSNGLKVMLTERHDLPVVDFWMLVNAGYSFDEPATRGLARLTNRMLTFGTNTRNALQISEESETLGAQLTANTTPQLSTVFLSALKQNLQPSLRLLGDVILNPSFPQEDFNRNQKQQIAAIGQQKVNPFQAAVRLMPGLLFGETHPYAGSLSGSGTEAVVAKLTRADLLKFHSTWYKPSNSTLVIVGDTTIAEIKPALEQAFGSWKPGSVPNKIIPAVKPPQAARVFLIDRPGSQQSMIVTGLIAPPKSASNNISIETMDTAFAGNFSGRLNMNIREDKHYSYGAGSNILGGRGERTYLASAPVQTDKTKESLIEVNKELHEIVGTRPLSAAELEAAKSTETLALPGSRETLAQVGGSLVDMVQYGLPDDYYDTFSARVKALKTSDVDDAAKSLIHPDRVTWIIVGDRSKIEAGIRELNLGELQIIDADGKKLTAP